jgi:hypothetical protein
MRHVDVAVERASIAISRARVTLRAIEHVSQVPVIAPARRRSVPRLEICSVEIS